MSDVSDIADVISLAMLDDEWTQVLYPHRAQHPACYRGHALRRTKKRIHQHNEMLVMVLDENDPEWSNCERVIGYAVVERNINDGHLDQRNFWDRLNLSLLWLEGQLEWYLRLDKCSSRPATIEFFAHLDDEGPFTPFENHYYLTLLVVHPDFQRRGIGARMLKEVQSIVAADPSKAPLLLVSSLQGHAMYLQCGFENIGKFNAGLDLDGAAMLWRPPSTEGHHEDGHSDAHPK